MDVFLACFGIGYEEISLHVVTFDFLQNLVSAILAFIFEIGWD